MFEQIRSAIDALEAVVRDLEPGIVDGPGATRLMELFVAGEHVCAAGKALATRRVAETGAYRDAGQRCRTSARRGEWRECRRGRRPRADRRTARRSPRNQRCVSRRATLRSPSREISYAASQDASCEGQLLRSAKRRTLKGLKEDCQRVLAASVADDAEWAKRLHDSRAVYRWAEPDGALHLDARLAPDAGAKVFSALDAETDRIFREARAQANATPAPRDMHDARSST